ncbi:MAG: PD-(D/E)XK nuclease family protein [Candidatus Thorarchaeota archaeon]|nr:MAG: PD-(D/E)XK nuclease family protein [Candidatus Thorarchaeota archaeon]
MLDGSDEIVGRDIQHGKVAYRFQWNKSNHKRLGASEGDLSSLWAHLLAIRAGKLPEEPFSSPFYTRASVLKFTKMANHRRVGLRNKLMKKGKVQSIIDHDLVSKLREYHRARNDDTYTADHVILQDFLLHDPASIAIEVPVWSERFGLSGHVDLVRFVDDEIQVCDYKPGKLDNTSKRFLDSIPQVAAYGEMMTHHLAGTLRSADESVLLPKVTCCIFDTHSCWQFGADLFITLQASNIIEGI